jgi:hypothetical protein
MYKSSSESESSHEEGPYIVKDPYSKFIPLDQYTKASISLSEYSMNHLSPGMLGHIIPLMPANDVRKLWGPYRNRML